MKRRRSNNDFDNGQDSFLDVMSNIVGILIILVVIAGIRMGQMPVPVNASMETGGGDADEITSESAKKLEEARLKFETQSVETIGLMQEAEELAAKKNEVEKLITLRENEKNGWLDLLGKVEAAISLKRDEMSGSEQAAFELNRRMRETCGELEEAQRTEKWLSEQGPETTVLKNLPTPIASGVKDNEVHFRLSGGKISYVPIETLLNKMAADVRSRQNVFLKKNELIDTVGPEDGFKMQYRVVCRNVTGGPHGTESRLMIELANCEFEPTPDLKEETLEQALSANSAFTNRLSQYRTDIYTVTIWIYPDSFREFRAVREFLYQKGYLASARPLPEGVPIAASPEGAKSTAQ